MSAQSISLETVDDYLGPSQGRFFGAGFRRVNYRYGSIAAESKGDGTGSVTTGLGVVYPADWSRKKTGADLRPHLSTVDGLITGVQMSEAALTHVFAAAAAERRGMRVRSVRIKAGTSPDENLDTLLVRSRITGTGPLADSRATLVSRTETQVGAMRVRCEITHPELAARGTAFADYASPEALLGPAADRYYGDGFTRRSHAVRGVAVDTGQQRAGAFVDCAEELPGSGAAGIEGAYQPFLSAVDCFVTSLQLGQVLLYELDEVERGNSNTLWMRTTTLTADPAAHPVKDGSRLSVQLEHSQLLERADGIWRTADIVGRLGGMLLRCGIAHRLPS